MIESYNAIYFNFAILNIEYDFKSIRGLQYTINYSDYYYSVSSKRGKRNKILRIVWQTVLRTYLTE